MIKGTILIGAIPLYMICRILGARTGKKNTSLGAETAYFVFFVYILVVIGVSVFPIMVDKMYVPFGMSRISTSLLPFSELIDQINQQGDTILDGVIIILKCMGGNFVLLLPFGLFYPVLFNDKHDRYHKYFVGFLLVMTIEFTQLLQTAYGYNILKVINMTDILFNILGFVVGYTISHMLIEKKKICRLVNTYNHTIREIESSDESA